MINEIHETYMAIMFVHSEKIKQRLQTIFVTEHNWRQMTIEELNSISNRWWPCRSRKRCIERLKIKLQFIVPNIYIHRFDIIKEFVEARQNKLLWSERKKCLLAVNKFFFEAKIFGNTELIDAKFIHIYTNVFPNTRSWTNCYGY